MCCVFVRRINNFSLISHVHNISDQGEETFRSAEFVFTLYSTMIAIGISSQNHWLILITGLAEFGFKVNFSVIPVGLLKIQYLIILIWELPTLHYYCVFLMGRMYSTSPGLLQNSFQKKQLHCGCDSSFFFLVPVDAFMKKISFLK